MLIDDFAAEYPDDVEHRGGEIFVFIEVAARLIDEAERRGVRIVGMEGFLIGQKTYPSLDRIADFSALANAPSHHPSCLAARELLEGPWRSEPTAGNGQMYREASGRYAIAFVLDG